MASKTGCLSALTGSARSADGERQQQQQQQHQQDLLAQLVTGYAGPIKWQSGLQGALSFRTLHRPALAAQRLRAASGVEPSGLQARGDMTAREYRKISESAVTSVQTWLSMAFPGEPDGLAPSVGGAEGATSAAPAAPAAGSTSPASPQAAAAGFSSEVPGPNTAQPRVRARQWFPVPCPEPSWETRYTMRVLYQHMHFEQQGDAYMVRASMRLPWPPLLVACLLADHSRLIQHLLPRRPTLPQAAVDRLSQMAEGSLPLVSQMQSARRVAEQVCSGPANEVYSEHLECGIGTPAAPHAGVRLWLLKSLRIARSSPEAAVQQPPSPQLLREHSGVDAVLRGESISSYLFVCTAAPAVVDAPSSWQDGAEASGLQADRGTSRRTSTASPRNGRAAPARVALVKPSGVLLRPAGARGEECEVSICLLPGKDAMRLISGDLLGERLIFWRTMENLLFVLESLAPPPADHPGAPAPLPPDLAHPLLARLEQCLSKPGGPESASCGSAGSRASSPAPEDTHMEVELVEM